MPVFSVFLGSLATAFVSLFARFMGFKLALKLAAYSAWLTIFIALLGSVFICLSSLYSMASALISGANGSGIPWVSYFFMGLGIFVPANAGAVVSCVASVWLSTGIYKFQRDAIRHFGS